MNLDIISDDGEFLRRFASSQCERYRRTFFTAYLLDGFCQIQLRCIFTVYLEDDIAALATSIFTGSTFDRRYDDELIIFFSDNESTPPNEPLVALSNTSNISASMYIE